MKNFYEILEIDQNASQEIVEKAYKVLVKKYLPDLQTTQNGKNKCEEKIKQINEAYDIISNSDLRAEYDARLQEEYNRKLQQQIEKEKEMQARQQEQTYKEAFNQKQYEDEQRRTAYEQNVNRQEYKKQRAEQERQQAIREKAEQEMQYRAAVNKAYHDAYIQDLKNRGYKIKYKKSLNDYMHSLVALLITIGIILLILQLPFVKNYLNDLYKDNDIIRGITDSIVNLFK